MANGKRLQWTARQEAARKAKACTQEKLLCHYAVEASAMQRSAWRSGQIVFHSTSTVGIAQLESGGGTGPKYALAD